MRIAGKKIEGPNVELIAIPRGTGDPIVFRAQAIMDYSTFDKLVPEPKPPVKIMRGGKRVKDTDAPSFKQAQEEFATRRIAWMVIESLKATEGLEWEKIDYDDPTTWHLFEDELRESGFSHIEVQRIIQGVFAANCLDEEKLEAARESFLASLQAATDQSSSQMEEQSVMQYGELASDSD